VVKIDGNPYSPQNLIPHFDYDSSLNAAAKKEGKLCPKGQAGIETLYDNYRIRKVLKRAGPRGSNKWKTISLDQAVEEIVNGGRLFEDIGEEREVEGLRDMFVLKESELSKFMQAGTEKIKDKKMTVSAFKEQYRDHLHILIDPDHPDLGPKNNQFVFLAGRIEHGRKEFMKRFTYDAFGSVNAVRQPASKPITENTIVDGEEMPICMESFLIAIAKRLGLSGFGSSGFGQGRDFDRPEDFYLKAIANIAMGDKENNSVPEADEHEIALFRNARKHLPDSVFNEEKWRKATGDEYWNKVLYVLNRGGRFEDSNGAYDGNYIKHKFGKMFNIYIEDVATSKNTMTGEYFKGIPIFEPIKDASGNEIEDKDYDFKLITYKDILGGQSRTRPADYWLGELENENRILMNKLDVQELGLKDGEEVKLVSKTNPTGTFDIGGGKRLSVKGKIKAIHGIRPGVVAVSWHYRHWAYGSNDVIIDGHIVKGDKRRGKGLTPNPVMREDETVSNVCLTDPIGGSASFYDTWVNILKA